MCSGGEEERKCLTGVGAESLRRLETPGGQVSSTSLKHERHRQGDKHDLPSCFDANNLTEVPALSSSGALLSSSVSLVHSFGDIFGMESSQHLPLGVYTCSPAAPFYLHVWMSTGGRH